MLTTEIEALKVFIKIPLIKIFIVLMLLPAGVFGWLWYDNQTKVLEQQKDCSEKLEIVQEKHNQKVEEIYKHFLEKTEKQVEAIREIQKQQSNEKVSKVYQRINRR